MSAGAAVGEVRTVRYPVVPVVKPRMTRADRFHPRPVVWKYFTYRDEILLKKVWFPLGGASITFGMPMPLTWWPKKKAEMEGKPHQSTPTLDNLIKGLCDAVYKSGDARVWELTARKVWADKGYIEVSYAR